jgi:hypothetical protein
LRDFEGEIFALLNGNVPGHLSRFVKEKDVDMQR